MSIVIKLRDDGLQLLFLLKRSAHVRRDKVHVVLLDVHLDIRHELAPRVADRIAQVHVRQQGSHEARRGSAERGAFGAAGGRRGIGG
jgi:hypothetical protein